MWSVSNNTFLFQISEALKKWCGHCSKLVQYQCANFRHFLISYHQDLFQGLTNSVSSSHSLLHLATKSQSLNPIPSISSNPLTTCSYQMTDSSDKSQTRESTQGASMIGTPATGPPIPQTLCQLEIPGSALGI